MIKDRSHHGASNEPIDPLWSRIHRFLLYTVYHDPTDLRSLILAQIILMQGILSCDTQHTCSIWSKNCEHFDFDFDMSTVNIKNICKSFSKKVAVLKWIKLLPKPILETIYYKTIIPSVLYGVVVWGSCSSALMMIAIEFIYQQQELLTIYPITSTEMTSWTLDTGTLLFHFTLKCT